MISVDEKPSIQALSRTTGYVRTSSGKIVRGLKSTYRRNGTLNLFAALNVATGEVRKKTTKTKTRIEFQAFMDEVVADAPAGQEIHVILDNYGDAQEKRRGAEGPSERDVSLHPDIGFLAQSDRNLVRHSWRKALDGRQLQQHRGPREGHRRLLRSLAGERAPIRVEETRSARQSDQKYYR